MDPLYRNRSYDFEFTVHDWFPEDHYTTRIPSTTVQNGRWRDDGVDNPFYREQIAQHTDATTPFSAWKRTVTVQGSGSAEALYTRSGTDDDGNSITRVASERMNGVFPFYPYYPDADSRCDEEAYWDLMGKLHKLLYNRQNTAQAGVFLGEIREVVHLIRHPAESLYRLIMGSQFQRATAFRKNKILQASWNSYRKVDRRKALSDFWLEMQYGWKPLINDIEDGLKAYNELSSKVIYESFVVTASSEQQGPVTTTPYQHSRIAWLEDSWTNYRTSYRAYGETYKNYGGAKAKLGISWGNFLPTVWELIPYSFLVDYFSNIGDVLNGVTLDYGVLRRVSATVKRQARTTVVFHGFSNPGFPDVTSVSGGHPPVTLESKSITRSPGLNLSVPRVRLELPGVGSLKWANLGALITSRYTRGIRR